MNNFASINGAIMVDLFERGFCVSEDGRRLEFAEGSISNYTKCTIYAPRMMWSLEKEGNTLACDLIFERFSESGQIEVDGHTTIEKAVAVNRLCEWLEAHGIRNRREMREKWEERKRWMGM